MAVGQAVEKAVAGTLAATPKPALTPFALPPAMVLSPCHLSPRLPQPLPFSCCMFSGPFPLLHLPQFTSLGPGLRLVQWLPDTLSTVDCAPPPPLVYPWSVLEPEPQQLSAKGLCSNLIQCCYFFLFTSYCICLNMVAYFSWLETKKKVSSFIPET